MINLDRIGAPSSTRSPVLQPRRLGYIVSKRLEMTLVRRDRVSHRPTTLTAAPPSEPRQHSVLCSSQQMWALE